MTTNYVEINKGLANTLFNRGVYIKVQYFSVPDNEIIWEYIANLESDEEEFVLDLQSKGCSSERVQFFVDEEFIQH